MTTSRPIPGDIHAWLTEEVRGWRTDGIVDAATASAIESRYTIAPSRGAGQVLGRILLGIGGLFLGVGLIWLVAVNLDNFSGLTRFVIVAVLWLAFLALPEWLAGRGHSRALVGSLRLVGALAFGALVFQAAQALQVPAYEPKLVGLWSAGALLHAYALRALMPLVVGAVTGTVWWFWQPLSSLDSGAAWIVLVALAATFAFGLAAAHGRALPAFSQVWRAVGVGFTLVALFAAALPFADLDGFSATGWIWVSVGAAVVALVAGLVRGDTLSRLEAAGGALVPLVTLGLLAWTTSDSRTDVGLNEWGHALVSTAVYVLVAVALTALGTLRQSPWMTGLAMTGLVVFTTFQSFAVFGAIITGAWLFLFLGVVFLLTGFAFDRARRQISASLSDEAAALNPKGNQS